MTTELPERYIEWRVTADHVDPNLSFPPFDFTWSKRINPWLCDKDGGAEAAARAFVQHSGIQQSLTNIRIHRRTVTIENWQSVED